MCIRDRPETSKPGTEMDQTSFIKDLVSAEWSDFII